MSKGNIYHRFRAILHLWAIQCMLPISITFVTLQILRRIYVSWCSSTSSPVENLGENVENDTDTHKKNFTVVLTGGKMSKTLHLVRCIRSYALSDPSLRIKIVVLETKKFRYSASRYSRCVDRFQVITTPRESPDAYMNDIYDVCKEHDATHFLPVAAPVEAVFDAELKCRLETELGMQVLHMDKDLCSILDDKHSFGCFLREKLKIRSLRTHKVVSNEEVRKYNAILLEEKKNGTLKRNMILKNLSYDPIHRLDLFQLPTEEEKIDAYLQKIILDGNPITKGEPWQLQEFLANGVEYSAMIVVRSNHLVTMTCCPSSASQLNYVHVEVPSIREWIENFMDGLAISDYTLTGQLCFDFMVLTEGDEKVAYPIECNPRVHTQCTIYNSDDVRTSFGSLLLNSTPQMEKGMVRMLDRDYNNNLKSNSSQGINVYWFYNEFFKIIPDSWLFTYNESNDAERRSKLAMQEFPTISNQLIIIAIIYAPAVALSFLMCLPIWLLLYVPGNAVRSKSVATKDLSDSEHLHAMIVKLIFFLDRLAHMEENIEGDFWTYDLLPFIAKNHVQVASRLLATIRTGVEWKKVDFAIGKVVEVGGD